MKTRSQKTKTNQGGEEVAQKQLRLTQVEFDKLSNQQKIVKGIEITRCLLTNSQIEEEIVIPDDVQSFTLKSIEVSAFPTESRKVMRYVKCDELQEFAEIKNFIQVDNYCVIFSNVEDLSYHNFENILNLDHLFNTIRFKIFPKQLFKSKKIQIFNMQGSMETLLSLDRLNYYTIPLNNQQRGGKRMIFHSNQLQYSLTKMIENSEFFDKENFACVNNVFRLNNFAPGDKKFKSHYDTPYADQSKHLYSKYTMIIYLTGNSEVKKGQAPLTIEDVVLKQINQNDCIIFDQKCQHEGNAYIDKNKIFIRTELIYKIYNTSYDQKVARMFNMACYMTKEPNQQQYSADLFNSIVKMRYRIQEEELERVFLMKQNLDVAYVTDGNYYWFPKNIRLQSIAVLIILDYFNGKIYDLKNVKIQSKTLPSQNSNLKSDETIFDLLETTCFAQNTTLNQDKITDFQNTKDFVPNSLCKNFLVYTYHYSNSSDGSGYSRRSSDYFQQKKQKAIQKIDSILDQNTVIIFDQQIKINYQKITIQMDDKQKNDLPSGKIRMSDFYINTQQKINFAGWVDFKYNPETIVFFKRKKLHTFCLPDISFQTFPNGIKLSIDMFNNGFIHHSTDTFNQPYTDKSKADDDADESNCKHGDLKEKENDLEKVDGDDSDENKSYDEDDEDNDDEENDDEDNDDEDDEDNEDDEDDDEEMDDEDDNDVNDDFEDDNDENKSDDDESDNINENKNCNEAVCKNPKNKKLQIIYEQEEQANQSELKNKQEQLIKALEEEVSNKQEKNRKNVRSYEEHVLQKIESLFNNKEDIFNEKMQYFEEMFAKYAENTSECLKKLNKIERNLNIQDQQQQGQEHL